VPPVACARLVRDGRAARGEPQARLMPRPPVTPGRPSPEESGPPQRPFGTVLLPLLAGMLFIAVLSSFVGDKEEVRDPIYSDFIAQVEAGKIRSVKLDAEDNSVEVVPRRGPEYETAFPDNTEQALLADLRERGIEVDVSAKRGGGWWSALAHQRVRPQPLVDRRHTLGGALQIRRCRERAHQVGAGAERQGGAPGSLGKRVDAAILGRYPHSHVRAHGHIFPLHESPHTMPLRGIGKARAGAGPRRPLPSCARPGAMSFERTPRYCTSTTNRCHRVAPARPAKAGVCCPEARGRIPSSTAGTSATAVLRSTKSR
jgi:hypothetical protein